MSRILDALKKAHEQRDDESEKLSPLREILRQKDGQLREAPLEMSGEQPQENDPEGESRQAHPGAGSGARSGVSPWFYGIGLSLALGLGLGLYLQSDPPPRAPVKPAARDAALKSPAEVTPQPDASPAQRPRKLPSAVPLQAPDPAYAAAHPGWQRYLTQAQEFRVFREDGAVKAIQVLARQEEPISLDFFLSLLGEVARRDSFRVQAVEEKGGYYIERGKAGDLADVIVYRKRPNGEIRGLVLVY